VEVFVKMDAGVLDTGVENKTKNHLVICLQERYVQSLRARPVTSIRLEPFPRRSDPRHHRAQTGGGKNPQLTPNWSSACTTAPPNWRAPTGTGGIQLLVSHDLRAPLRAMDGFSMALIEDYAGKLDATAQNYLRRIGPAAADGGADRRSTALVQVTRRRCVANAWT